MSDESKMQLGIDVGGTSIKGAVVDLGAGELAGGIHTEPTPPTATPVAVVAAIGRIAAAAAWSGSVGVALPGVIDGASLRHAPNLSSAFQEDGALACLRASEGANAVLINDADAAGLAELTYGDAGLDRAGLTIVLTFGTGIGSALLHNGDLIANSELGGLVGTNGRFEEIASGRAISNEELTPVEWARRAQPFFDELEAMLNPSRWVVGGGLSEKFDRFASRLKLSKPISVAHLGSPRRHCRRGRGRPPRRGPLGATLLPGEGSSLPSLRDAAAARGRGPCRTVHRLPRCRLLSVWLPVRRCKGIFAELVRRQREKGTELRRRAHVILARRVPGSRPARPVRLSKRCAPELLTGHLDIGPDAVHGPNPHAADLDAECARYEQQVRDAKIGLQLLGIGSNGHIAFNEPGSPLDSTTRVVALSEQTRADNARLFSRGPARARSGHHSGHRHHRCRGQARCWWPAESTRLEAVTRRR